MSTGSWRLLRRYWKDNLEELKLRDSTNREFCSYVQTERNTWLLWMNHFPIHEFASRSGAIHDAEKKAGHVLEIKTEGMNGRNDSSSQNSH